MKIVFMGTPDFAVPCLQALIDNGHNVVGVFSQPDKPKGRHYVLTPPPVKECALKNSIPVYQPTTLKDGQALEILKELDPEVIIVVAYGKILPVEILNLPPHGCINMHASLLPKLRGAAPIQWSILNGFAQTGVTAMQMDAGLDTGDMLLKASLQIGEDETAGELHDRLSVLGAELLIKTLDAVQAGTLAPEKQNDAEFTYAPMLNKALCPIDWNETAQNVHNKIRGLSEWPTAVTTLGGKIIKVRKSRLCDDNGGKAGEIVCAENRLVVSCGDSKCVEILILQAEGKKAMSAVDYMRGNAVEKGSFFE